jgi:hypothetical protein
LPDGDLLKTASDETIKEMLPIIVAPKNDDYG